MKLVSLSEKLLKQMVMEYKNSGREMFSLDFFKDLSPHETDSYISNALYKLETDGFVNVQTASNIAYMTALKPQGIVNVEENTMIKKGYKMFKEIKGLIR